MEDEGGWVSLVVLHNSVVDRSSESMVSGSAKMLIRAPDLAGHGVDVLKFDDKSARNESRPGSWCVSRGVRRSVL